MVYPEIVMSLQENDIYNFIRSKFYQVFANDLSFVVSDFFLLRIGYASNLVPMMQLFDWMFIERFRKKSCLKK